MSLMERVSTLLRANLNDLFAKSEDPEKLAQQLVHDMQDQLVQVKTKVAIAIAAQHALSKKQSAEQAQQATWHRKAELAVARNDDTLARTALERALTHERMAQALAHQHTDQSAEVDALRAAYTRLDHKLTETRNRVELLTLQLRRNRAASKAAQSLSQPTGPPPQPTTLTRLAARAEQAEAEAHTARALLSLAAHDPLEDRPAAQEDAIEALLRDLKSKR